MNVTRPHKWVRPILKSKLNSKNNSVANSRQSGDSTPLEFINGFHTIREFNNLCIEPSLNDLKTCKTARNVYP